MVNQVINQYRISYNPWPEYTRFINRKQYEITDHPWAERSRGLGSTRVIVNDRAITTFSEEDSSVTGACGERSRTTCADVLSLLNYYPGGQLQPGMTWENTGYRYGYNTQERSDEIFGPGNFYTAEFWEYDTRIWRRWNRDITLSYYAHLSPYSTLGNNPILYFDKNGDFFTGPSWLLKEVNKIYGIAKEKAALGDMDAQKLVEIIESLDSSPHEFNLNAIRKKYEGETIGGYVGFDPVNNRLVVSVYDWINGTAPLNNSSITEKLTHEIVHGYQFLNYRFGLWGPKNREGLIVGGYWYDDQEERESYTLQQLVGEKINVEEKVQQYTNDGQYDAFTGTNVNEEAKRVIESNSGRKIYTSSDLRKHSVFKTIINLKTDKPNIIIKSPRFL